MTAPTAVKTPMMSIPFYCHITKGQAEAFVKKIRNIMLSDVITRVTATEKLEVSQCGNRVLTSVRIEIGSELCKNHNMDPVDVLTKHLEKKLFKMFAVKLQAAIKARSKAEIVMNVKEKNEKRSVNRGDIEDEEGVEREIDPNQERDEAEYGDSDLEGEADEAPSPEEQLEGDIGDNDEGFGSGGESDEEGNITLANIDDRFKELMEEELNEADLSDEDDRMEVVENTSARKEAIKDVFHK